MLCLEATLTIPIKLGSSRRKNCRALLGTCPSSSLAALELLRKELKNHKAIKINKRTRGTRVGELTPNGIVAVRNSTLPALTTQHKFSTEFSLLPENSNYSCHFIMGAKDLRTLRTAMHL